MPQSHQRLRRFGVYVAAATMVVTGFGVTAGAAGAADTAPDAPQECALQPAGNARYVAWTYQKVLFRCPDPGGLHYWTTRLDNGMSRFGFVLAIDNSDENIIGNNVVALYEGVLHRAPTAAETANWATRIRAERNDGPLFATLYGSDAFWNSPVIHGDTDAYIAFLYSAVLDRVGDQSVADPQGFSFFQEILGTNPTEAQRQHVALRYFEESTENARDWVWASYHSGLGRPADPAGGVFWTDWVLDNGFRTFDMCNALEASNEAYANAQVQQNPPPEPEH